MSDPKKSAPAATRAAILTDKLMNHFIKIGGMGIIAAVFGIFLFILLQIIPLFRSAEVDAPQSRPVGSVKAPVALAVDEWNELPFLIDADASFHFFPAGTNAPFVQKPEAPAGAKISALTFVPNSQTVIAGLDDGRFYTIQVDFEAEQDGARRVVTPELTTGKPAEVGLEETPIRLIGYAAAEDAQLVVVAQTDTNGSERVHAALYARKRTLMGGGKLALEASDELTSLIDGHPARLLVNHRLDGIIVVTREHYIEYLQREGETWKRVQRFQPFPGGAIAQAELLFGDDSLILASAKGENVAYSLFVGPTQTGRQFTRTKIFPALPGEATAIARSLRNKAFLVAGKDFASLRFSTSADIRWASKSGFEAKLAAIGGKYDSLWFFDGAALHGYPLRDPHPESGLRAFFSKIWYEGAPQPKFEWQSSGGTDDFEPKLSMVPLLIGTLKGTFYALLFSVPLALLAALYTSQFAHPDLRRFIKPVMEIMASLPSVILGFLAAIWLAPIMETRVPSFLLALVALPVSCAAFGAIWSRLPHDIRRRIREGHEFLYAIPLVLLVSTAAWHLGPAIESLLFLAKDPSTGRLVADFRLWWREATGLPFEQRNSLVVGFMMGFAVIPIIFTIAEDALSNVPAAFRSASLALGASRWQTSLRVILPTASAGIFSAVMIGFGRAVGETMIVLMATGNTPIMNFNIFSGMRTLSANIAVELPEAPAGGTLFRSLYLGAMLLFLMTFFVNTLAELLRHHLREKFKAV